MFGNIPWGIYIIRETIPVQDPVLPAFVFEMSLERMMEEVLTTSDEAGRGAREEQDHRHEESLVGDKMADLYLETLQSWGAHVYHLKVREDVCLVVL